MIIVMNNQLANSIPLAPPGGFTLPGFLGQTTGATAPLQLSNVISTAIGVMTIIAFIWFTIQFFLAAVSIIGAGADKAKLEGAKSKLSTSIIGVVVVVAAIFLIEIVGLIFGIPILDIPGLIAGLTQ